MEKYTMKTDGPTGVALTFSLDIKLPNMEQAEKLQDMIIRLAAYEDTNRTPEELQRLVDLQERRLLVELQCKPNKIYWHRNIDSGMLELNIEMHELQKHDDKYPEIEYCAYWE